MDMADLIAEVKALRAKVKDLETKSAGGDSEAIAVLKKEIEGLKKQISKPLEDSDFDRWE